jgi:excisionase family DNA binding protein
MTDDAWTVKQVAAYLKLHPTTIYRLLKTRQLPAFRVGSDWCFDPTEIDCWRKEREKEARLANLQ